MTEVSRLAVMQPYFFPAASYFQLVYAVDSFVFYDDVSYIKQGWINRNRLQQAGKELLFSVPVAQNSHTAFIRDIGTSGYGRWKTKFLKTLVSCYASAPYFEPVYDLVADVVRPDRTHIADLAMDSVIATSRYLGLTAEFSQSSIFSPETRGIGQTERLLALCHKANASVYINTIGGRDLYKGDEFLKHNIVLQFLSSEFPNYKQSSGTFVGRLSIIDVMMYMSPDMIKASLPLYDLIS